MTEAVAAFVEEGWRRGAVVQVLATDERFDASALRWADVSVLQSPMPLEAAAMEWSDVHVSFRAMTQPVVDADPRRIAALRRGRGAVSTMRWQGTRWALVRVPTRQWADAMGVDDRTYAPRVGRLLRRGLGRRRLVACRRSATGSPAGARPSSRTTGASSSSSSGAASGCRSRATPTGPTARSPPPRVETDVHGRIRFPGPLSFAGVIIRDLELELRGRPVVAERATEGLRFVRELLDADEGARRVGELGIGTNAALTTTTGDLLIDEKILGTVHIAPGRAYPECGGVNSSSLHWDIVKDLRGGGSGSPGSLRVDDEWLVRRGVVQPALRAAAVPFLPVP